MPSPGVGKRQRDYYRVSPLDGSVFDEGEVVADAPACDVIHKFALEATETALPIARIESIECLNRTMREGGESKHINVYQFIHR